jgi:hypothetical protein
MRARPGHPPTPENGIRSASRLQKLHFKTIAIQVGVELEPTGLHAAWVQRSVPRRSIITCGRLGRRALASATPEQIGSLAESADGSPR